MLCALLSFLSLLFLLPLCAADKPQIKKPSSPLPIEYTVWELVVHNGSVPLSELKRYPAISTHLYWIASAKLDDYRKKLKKYVETSAPSATITYSPDSLSAAYILRTEYTSEDSSEDANEVDVEIEMDFLHYTFCVENNDLESTQEALPQPRMQSCLPFFTKKYLCLDFGLDHTTGFWSENTINGLRINRVTKKRNDSWFFVSCNGRYVETGWFMYALPHLYATIMKQSYHFAYGSNFWLRVVTSRSYGEDCATMVMKPGFIIKLAQTGILTPKDVKILSKFVPGGRYEKEIGGWPMSPPGIIKDIIQEKKDGSPFYLYHNILACYGSNEKLCSGLDNYIGKRKIKLPGYGTFSISCCHDTVFFEGRGIVFEHYNQPLSAIAQATVDYVQRLKQEKVFVEKDWTKDTPSREKREKWWHQAMHFLKNDRMTPRTQGHRLILYDCLSNTVRIFSHGPMGIDHKNKVQGPIYYSEPHTVSKNIDPQSIQVLNNGHIEYCDRSGRLKYSTMVADCKQ